MDNIAGHIFQLRSLNPQILGAVSQSQSLKQLAKVQGANIAYMQYLTHNIYRQCISGSNDAGVGKALVSLLAHASIQDLYSLAAETNPKSGHLLSKSWLTATLPVAVNIVLKCRDLPKARALLRNPYLLKIGFLLQAEMEFKAILHVIELEDPTETISWNVFRYISTMHLEESKQVKIPASTNLPGRQALEVCRNYDLFDWYVRAREQEIELLQLASVGMRLEKRFTDLGINQALDFCLSHLENTKWKGLTMRFHPYEDVIGMHEDRVRINSAVVDWIIATFPESTQKYFLTDPLLYDCVNYIYSFISDWRVMVELAKTVLLGFYVDVTAELNPNYCLTLFDAFSYSQKSEIGFPTKGFAGEGWPDENTAVLRAFIASLRTIRRLVKNCDPAVYWKQYAMAITKTRAGLCTYRTMEDYFAERSTDLAMECYNCIGAAWMGHTLEDLPAPMLEIMTKFYILENDLFSYGKELIENHFERHKILNSIEIFKAQNPELSYQHVVNELEEMRDNYYAVILSWKNTKFHNWYHIALGLTHVQLFSKRYGRQCILSKSSLLVKSDPESASNTVRPDVTMDLRQN